MPQSQERRRHPRYARIIPFRGRKEPGHPEEAVLETINLSVGGALCRVSHYIPVMTRLHLRGVLPLEGESRTIHAEAVVVRVDPDPAIPACTDYRVALYFSSIAEEDRRTLEAWLVG